MGENPSPLGEDFSNYRKGSRTLYELKYHLVWITKYRKQVLIGAVADAFSQ